MRYVIVLAALLLAGQAFAQTCPVAPADPVPRDAVRLNWVRPTTYTDGAAIPGSASITYTVYERVGTTDTLRCTTTSVSAGQTGLAAGPHTWVVSAKIGTAESAKSNAATKTIASPIPSPPTNLTTDPDNLVAFGSQQSDERQTVYPVGTVAANTSCDVSMSANGLYRVPKTAVTWAGDVRPAVVFAQCQPSGG